MRLVVPYLIVLLLASTLVLSVGSSLYLAFAALQIIFWSIAALALRYRITVVHRIASPASALLLLKVAAVVGLYRFLFTRGPLWKIWNSNKPAAETATHISDHSALPEDMAAAIGNDRV
jgi:hypothetical protein